MTNKALFHTSGSCLFYASGRALLTGSGGGGGSTFTGPYPSAITGLSGWWDAGLLANMVQSTPGANQMVGGLTDLSGNGNAIVIDNSGTVDGTSGVLATPRLNGALMGIGCLRFVSNPSGGAWAPFLSNPPFAPPQTVQMGSGSAWTRYLVYSRPNLNQSQNVVNTGNQQPLLCIGSTVILALTSNGVGTPDSLLLFPGSGQTVLSSSMSRRHTHSLTIRNTPGTGIDVWLDDTQVATAVTNPLGASLTNTLRLLSSPALDAQCYFHEFAMWEKALSAPEIGTLLTNTTVVSPNSAGSCSKRWARGVRAGLVLPIVGQSNASNFFYNAGLALAETLQYYLGLLSCNVIGLGTISSGTPIFEDSADTTAWLANPGDGSDPSTWSTGAMGAAFVSTMGGANQGGGQPPLTATDLADVWALYGHWSENDSISHGYSDKTVVNHAIRRMLLLMRASIGKAANALPVVWLNPLPYGGTFNEGSASNDGDMQGLRETLFDVAGDSTQNFRIGLPMTADAMGNGATYNGTTGLWTGGDNAHMDGTDNLRYARRVGITLARAVYAAGLADAALTPLPIGLPVVGGPYVSHVYLENSTTAIVTITHDAGNDLLVPLQAVNGVGWTLMDGGTVASPGVLHQATACARIDATHLQLTFPTIANTASACQLFYPWSIAKIGPGDAVTDNYSTLTPPSGFNVGADLGAQWGLNYPIQSSLYGFAVSSTPT